MSCSIHCGFCGICSTKWDLDDEPVEPIGCSYCGFDDCEGGCIAHLETLEDEAADAAYDARIDNDLDLDEAF